MSATEPNSAQSNKTQVQKKHGFEDSNFLHFVLVSTTNCLFLGSKGLVTEIREDILK